MASVASAVTSSVAAERGSASTPDRPPPRVRRSRASPSGDSGRPRRHARHSTPALHDVEGHQLRVVLLATRDAAVEEGGRALEGQDLEEEGRGHHGRVPLGQGGEGPHDHLVEAGVGVALLAHLVDHLEHGQGRPTSGRGPRGPARKVSMTSTWLMVSRSPRPCQPSRATWLSGSSRDPNFDVVRRTPLATARTLPWCSVIRVTIRSASPRRMVRSTTPRSRNWVIARGRAPRPGRRRSRRVPARPSGRRRTGRRAGPRSGGSGTGSGRLNCGARRLLRPLSRLPAPIMMTRTGGMTTNGAAAVNPACQATTTPA